MVHLCACRGAPQALEALQIKRAADHAYFRDMLKRQRRMLEQQQQLEFTTDGTT